MVFARPEASPTDSAVVPTCNVLLLDLGFRWVSGKYPRHAMGEVGTEPGPSVYDAIVSAQAEAQPFVYPTGLVEIPMSPVSDVWAFRNGPLATGLVSRSHSARRHLGDRESRRVSTS